MPNLVVVAGYVSPGRKGYSNVLTLDGAQFEIKDEDITKRFPLDTNQNGALRLFINPDADLAVSHKAAEFFVNTSGLPSVGHGPFHKVRFDPPKEVPDDR